MKEEHLHQLWNIGAFNDRVMNCAGKEELVVHDHGKYNIYSGPDFTNGRISLDGEMWIGNIEIHLRSSDWNRHRHSIDPAYDNVILHVVWEHDEDVILANGRILPTLELSHLRFSDLKFEDSLKEYFAEKKESNESQISNSELRDALVRRLERKADLIRIQLFNCHGDKEELFYRLLMRHCGMKVNNDPFEWLSQITPLSLLRRYSNDAHRLEALLFGQAGMLNANAQLAVNDEKQYYISLQREYIHLRHLHSLTPVDTQAWKYMRLRPNNYPDTRISQVAQLIFTRGTLYRNVVEEKDQEKLRELLSAEASEYWDTHYRFHSESRNYKKVFGSQFLNGLLINVIAPLRYFETKSRNAAKAMEIAEEFLNRLPPEENAVVKKFTDQGLKVKSAADSQAILELSERKVKHTGI